MKLTLHIVWKDFLCLRGRLAWWVTVLMAKTTLGFTILTGDAPGYFAQHAMEVSILLVGLDIGLCFLLAALLVQEDLLVGTQPLWLTRPISGARLLAAKLLGAGLLFGALPVLIWLPWWLHCGYGVCEIAWAAAETLFWQMLVVVPAILLASLTDSLSRVLLWSLVLLAGVAAGAALSGQWFSGVSTSVGASRVTLMVVILIAAALTTVVLQYFSRQHWRSLVWFGVGCAATLVTAALWPWNIYAGLEHRNLSEENAALAAGAILEFESAVAVILDRHDVAEGRQRVDVHLRMLGLPANLIGAGDAVQQTWRWTDGPELSIEGWSWGTTDGMGKILGIAKRDLDAETQHYLEDRRTARGLPNRKAPPPKDGQHFNISGLGARSMVARLSREPSTYHATANFLLIRAEVWFDEALAPSSWRTHSATGFRIARVMPRGAVTRLTNVQTQGLLADYVPHGLNPWRWMQLAIMGEPMLRVINRPRGDSLVFAWDAACAPVRVGTVMVRWMTGDVKSPLVIRDGKWVPRDGDWLDQARFVVVGASEVGRIVREVRVDRFTAAPAAKK